MARVNSKGLGLKFKYLSMIAFEMFQTNRDSVSLSDLKLIHQRYEGEYMVSADQGKLLTELEEGQVLRRTGEWIEFKYKYGYYYFVAEYLHDGISNIRDAALLRKKLHDMADNAYNEQNAHILIFYLYMSKDRDLMEYILRNAKALFASEGTSDLNDDVAFVNALYEKTPKLEAPPEDTDKNRMQYRERQDKAAESEDVDPRPSDDPESRRMDFAFQSMNIMGQVLRNFPADLRADLKLALMQESYYLGLRALRVFLCFLSANSEEFRREMFSYFRMLQPFSRRPDAEVQTAADKAVRGFAELVVFGAIKKISNSAGSEELRETYATVRHIAGEDHVPTRMIDLAIRLDHFAQIPERDVEDLKEQLKRNPSVYMVLRMLVGEFLYLFPVEYRVRQRMIKLLDFHPGASTLTGPKKIKRLKTAAQ